MIAKSVFKAASLIALLSTSGCNPAAPPGSATATVAPPAIAMIKPEKRAIKRVIEQPGAVHAFEETVLFAKFPGFVLTLGNDPIKKDQPLHDRMIDIGSRVSAGQVLLQLSIPELEQEFQQKEAVVRQLEAEVVQAKKALAASEAGIVAARAHVTEAKASLSRAQALYDRWKSEADRVARLVAGGVIDTQTRDETLNQFKSAEAGRNEATAKIASAEAAAAKAVADHEKAAADITATEARRDVSKADVRRVDALRDYTRIKAPFDGIVTRRSVATGDYVTADGKHGLLAVAKIDPVRVVISVPEADAGLIGNGQDVRLAMQAVAGPGVAGKVVRTSWSLDPGSRTLRAEIDLPNPDGKLRPGMYVNARLTVELPVEWTVPAATIGTSGDEPFAYLAENGKAVRVIVQLGRGDSAFTQIRGYKKPGQSVWSPITGDESIASPVTAFSDGQQLPANSGQSAAKP